MTQYRTGDKVRASFETVVDSEGDIETPWGDYHPANDSEDGVTVELVERARPALFAGCDGREDNAYGARVRRVSDVVFALGLASAHSGTGWWESGEMHWDRDGVVALRDALTEVLGEPKPDPTEVLEARVRELLGDDKRIPAIKLYRETIPGTGLREARDAVYKLGGIPRTYHAGDPEPADHPKLDGPDGERLEYGKLSTFSVLHDPLAYWRTNNSHGRNTYATWEYWLQEYGTLTEVL